MYSVEDNDIPDAFLNNYSKYPMINIGLGVEHVFQEASMG